jgi:hypothetical protein
MTLRLKGSSSITMIFRGISSASIHIPPRVGIPKDYCKNMTEMELGVERLAERCPKREVPSCIEDCERNTDYGRSQRGVHAGWLVKRPLTKPI